VFRDVARTACAPEPAGEIHRGWSGVGLSRVRVRLLGPCSKTGQMDTDLLAIDCHGRTDTVTSIDRRPTQSFRGNTERPAKAALVSAPVLYGRTACELRIDGEITLVGELEQLCSTERPAITPAYGTRSAYLATCRPLSHTVALACQLVMALARK